MSANGLRHLLKYMLCISMIFNFQFSIFNLLQAQDSVVTVRVGEVAAIEMVYVEGGTFTMGSNEGTGVRDRYDCTGPEHRVMLESFYIARFEVTQGLWSAVMGENPSNFRGSDSLPVERVSWADAQRFCLLLSQMTGRRFRLPTEAEWEYAARGGVRGRGKPYAGCERGALGNYAWFCVNSGGRTYPVGRLEPNELGLYDMSGNVAEWCSDWMGDYSADSASAPHGPAAGDSRVVRGGHYYSTSSSCAVFDRGWYVPTGKTEYYGLRVVMEMGNEE